MKRWLFAGAAACAFALPASAALKVGDSAPPFSARAALAGKAFDFSLKQSLRKGPVVVYFFPAAFTNGCNIQAHGFAQRQAQFAAAGATVVGVSLDTIGRLAEFSADPAYCGGKVVVASDVDGAIAAAYALNVRQAVAGKTDTRGAAIEHGLAERATFVVGRDGRIAGVIAGVDPEANVGQALALAQTLAAGRR
ncbi:MAG: redoxin domain-containing protein [Pseudomonadota bacterium]